MSVPPHSFIAARTAFRSSALRTNGCMTAVTPPRRRKREIFPVLRSHGREQCLHARQRRAFAGTEHAAPLDERAVRALGAEPEPSVVQKDALPFRDGAQHLLRQRDTVLAERDVRSLFERHRLTEPPDAQLRSLHIKQQADAPAGLPLGGTHRIQIRLCLAQRCVRQVEPDARHARADHPRKRRGIRARRPKRAINLNTHILDPPDFSFILYRTGAARNRKDRPHRLSASRALVKRRKRGINSMSIFQLRRFP